MADRAFLQRLERELTDKGQLIEAGFVSLRLVAIPLDAPASQIEEMRNAFFAGAQHLFASMLDVLDEGSEPTAKDLERMDLIDRELKKFINDFTLRHTRAGGSA